MTNDPPPGGFVTNEVRPLRQALEAMLFEDHFLPLSRNRRFRFAWAALLIISRNRRFRFAWAALLIISRDRSV